jgi:hypothetical protein
MSETAQLHTSSAHDILINKAGELMQQAQLCEDRGERHDAFVLYQRSSEILLGLLNNEADQSAKVNTALRLKIVLDKKEHVKQEIDRSFLSSNSLDGGLTGSAECVVIISVENISVYQIIGCEEVNQERRLLGKGVLKVLRCKAPEDFYLLQLQPDSGDSQFQFPLTKAIPCLCTLPGFYVFPMQGNLFYGVVFPREIPHAYTQLFEKVLDDCCCLRKLPTPPPDISATPQCGVDSHIETTEILVQAEVQIAVAPQAQPFSVRALNTISTGIAVGADYLVEGITAGSQLVAVGAHKGGEFIKGRITPPAEPVRVSPKVTSTIYVAGKLSPVCVAVSKALINSLATLAEEIGSAVAGSIVNSTLGSKVAIKKESPTSQAAKEMGKTSLQAFINIWDACEKAGRLLLKETGNVTIDIVQTKYGDEVGQVTRDGLKIAGNVLETAYNVDQMGVKKIMKKAAKHAGKSTVNQLLIEIPEKKELSLPAPKNNLTIT